MSPEMHINTEILKRIGLRLHSGFPSVIAEYVANSWDAGAQNVEITVPQKPLDESYTVEIHDDGVGMTPEELNSNFLVVGRRSRKEPSIEVKGETRQVMGRKGVGVLSGFSVARVLEVKSQKDGKLTAIRINYNNMANDIKDGGTGNIAYHPEIVQQKSTSDSESGTTIRLSQLNREQRPRTDFLKQKLARQFSVTTRNFIVRVNGEEIDISDRNLKSRCEYTWPIHEGDIGSQNHDIMGWIGMMKNPSGNDFQEGIAIVANGRVIGEPRYFIPQIEDERIPFQYMVGTIHANFLDSETDIVTSSRESIIWNKEPAKSLESRIQERVSAIIDEWRRKRKSKYLDSDGIPKPKYLQGYTIDELISEYEGNKIEYKQSLSSGKKLAKEVVAFANSDGGVIIVGVDDTGNATGVNDPDTLEGQIVGWVRDLIDPPISPSIQKDEYENESIVVIEIFSNNQKACCVNGRFVQRVGSRIQSMTYDELVQNWPKNIE